MPLTFRQRRFISEYVKDMSGTKAAIRAGYSASTADTQASRLLRKRRVADEIASELERRAVQVDLKPNDILRELKTMASVDLSQAFDEKGRLLPLHEMPADVRRMISSVETEELWGMEPTEDGMRKAEVGQVRKVKFWPKDKALELLGKHLRMFTDRLEVGADEGFADLLKRARERAKR